MKKVISVLFFILLLAACTEPVPESPLERAAKSYRQQGDAASLQRVIDLLEPEADTARVRELLGEPIDMGFDYRYLLDSTGENGCVVGAVFHVGEGGLIDQKWIGEICE